MSARDIPKEKRLEIVKDMIENDKAAYYWAEKINLYASTITNWFNRYKSEIGYPDAVLSHGSSVRDITETRRMEIVKDMVNNGTTAQEWADYLKVKTGTIHTWNQKYKKQVDTSDRVVIKARDVSEERRKKIAEDIIENGTTVKEWSESLGITAKTIRKWRDEYQKDTSDKKALRPKDISDERRAEIAEDINENGTTIKEWSKFLNISESVIREWRTRYSEKGIANSIDKSAKGIQKVRSLDEYISDKGKLFHVVATFDMDYEKIKKYADAHDLTKTEIDKWHSEALAGLGHRMPGRFAKPTDVINRAMEQIRGDVEGYERRMSIEPPI